MPLGGEINDLWALVLKLLIRIIAVLAALSVAFTIWFIARIAASGGMRSLATSGMLGVLTLAGWLVSLIVGPFAAVQLWKYQESGRRAGAILFGYGLAYYVIGLFVLRQPGAQVGQIIVAAALYAIPFVVLMLPAAHVACANGKQEWAG
jgi:hypothetical protein